MNYRQRLFHLLFLFLILPITGASPASAGSSTGPVTSGYQLVTGGYRPGRPAREQKIRNEMTVFMQESVFHRHIDRGIVGIITRDGLVYYKGQGMTRTDIVPIYSITKTMTAVLIMQLYSRNKLQLSATPNQWTDIPPESKLNQTTLEDLLHHSSGMADYGKAYSVSGFDGSTFRFFEPRKPPGASYRYCNGNFRLLGLIAERISGQPLSRLFQKRLFEPLGIKTYRLEGLNGASGVHTNLLELGKFMQMLMNEGSANGTRILPTKFFSRMTQKKSGVDYGSGDRISGKGLFIDKSGEFLYHHGLSRVNTATYRLYPKFAVVQLSEAQNFNAAGFRKWRAAALDQAAKLGKYMTR